MSVREKKKALKYAALLMKPQLNGSSCRMPGEAQGLRKRGFACLLSDDQLLTGPNHRIRGKIVYPSKPVHIQVILPGDGVEGVAFGYRVMTGLGFLGHRRGF